MRFTALSCTGVHTSIVQDRVRVLLGLSGLEGSALEEQGQG